jgi:hypothetical protein
MATVRLLGSLAQSLRLGGKYGFHREVRRSGVRLGNANAGIAVAAAAAIRRRSVLGQDIHRQALVKSARTPAGSSENCAAVSTSDPLMIRPLF